MDLEIYFMYKYIYADQFVLFICNAYRLSIAVGKISARGNCIEQTLVFCTDSGLNADPHRSGIIFKSYVKQQNPNCAVLIAVKSA